MPTKTAATPKITATAIAAGLKKERFNLDYHNQAYEQRSISMVGGAVNVTEWRHTSMKQSHFRVVWYTGNKARYWNSKEVDTVKEAAVVANEQLEGALAEYNKESSFTRVAFLWTAKHDYQPLPPNQEVFPKFYRRITDLLENLTELVQEKAKKHEERPYDKGVVTDMGFAITYLDKAEKYLHTSALRVAARYAAKAPQQTYEEWVQEVKSFLKSLDYGVGGRAERVEFSDDPQYPGFTVETSRRQRLDHYVGKHYHPGPDDDEEGWDSEGWWDDYAGPLQKKVQGALDGRFGKDVMDVDIGEKGHVEVNIQKKNLKLGAKA